MITEQTVRDAHANAAAHGFWDGPVNLPEKLCLIHSEVSEALEVLREGRPQDDLGEELADVVIRVMDLCGKLDIDLVNTVHAKMRKNASRPRLHGKRF